MFELDEDDCDGDDAYVEFPDIVWVIKGQEIIAKPKESIIQPVVQDNVPNIVNGGDTGTGAQETTSWQVFRLYSPVIDALVRWNKLDTVTVKDLCHFLEIGKASSPSLKFVKTYLSGKKTSLDTKYLKKVLEISNKLLLNDLVNYCKYRIQKLKLTKNNFLQILQICTLYDFVHRDMKNFVRSHLQLLADKEGSETLTYDTVVNLLTDEELSYWSMEERFSFITKWCKACTSRVSVFPSLFELIEISCLDIDFIRKFVRSDSLVISSRYCVQRVDEFLQLEGHNMLPIAILVDTREKNAFVFDLENKRSGYSLTLAKKLKTLKYPIVSCTAFLPETIILISSKHMLHYINYLNLNSGEMVSKDLYIVIDNMRVMMRQAQLVYREDVAFLLCRTKDDTSSLYMKDKETTATVSFVPLVSFNFAIVQLCAINSFLLLRSQLLHCFNWGNHSMKQVNIPNDTLSSPYSPLLALVPLYDTICAVYQSYIVQFTLDENKVALIPIRKVYVDVGSDPFVTIATTEGVLVRVDNDSIHVCDSLEQMSPWKSFDLLEGNMLVTERSPVCYGYLKSNIAICHTNCPHCMYRDGCGQFEDDDINFETLKKKRELIKKMKLQKEHERKRRIQRQEEEERRRRLEFQINLMQILLANRYDDDDDFYVVDDDDDMRFGYYGYANPYGYDDYDDYYYY